MKCEYVRDMIMTDYIDGRMGDERRLPLEKHLAVCPGCRGFLAQAMRASVRPLKGSRESCVPEYLWGQIKISLDVNRSVLSRIKEAFECHVLSVFILPRPALIRVVAGVLVLVTAAFIAANQPIRQREIVNEYLQEQMTYIASVDMYGNEAGSDRIDLGTDIEAYLF